jgi:hypothetical protein
MPLPTYPNFRSGGTPGATGFNLNPASRPGNGAYGAVPGAIGLPNPAGDLAAVYPNLSARTGAASSLVGDELAGTVSGNTLNALGNAAAARGVSSGMPGVAPGSLGSNGLFANIAGYSENRQRQGLEDYLSTIAGISKTQTVSPELQTEVASQNAVYNAAPDPALAAKEQQSLFDKYFQESRGAQGAQDNLPWYTNPYQRRQLGTGGVVRTPYNFGGI